jgi:hypothetical protein
LGHFQRLEAYSGNDRAKRMPKKGIRQSRGG